MALEQVKLGRFDSWAQSLTDNGIIVLASFYGSWLDHNSDIDARNQFLYKIVQANESATVAFKEWIIRHLSDDDKSTYNSAQRQARRCYASNEAFANAEHDMLAELIFTIFELLKGAGQTLDHRSSISASTAIVPLV